MSARRETGLDLDAIEARNKLATPGPWTFGEPLYGENRFIVAALIRNVIYPATNSITHGTREVDDAAFIAHARQDVPALLAEVRHLRAVAASLRHLEEAALAYVAADRKYSFLKEDRADEDEFSKCNRELEDTWKRLCNAVDRPSEG